MKQSLFLREREVARSAKPASIRRLLLNLAGCSERARASGSSVTPTPTLPRQTARLRAWYNRGR